MDSWARKSMSPSPTILIAMPLFEGWEHVGETLQSIKRQTYQNFRVLISVDGGDRRSYAACEPHLNDQRFEIVLQDKRLYWEGNVNWLANQLHEDYFCYWQHDDFCDPTYLQKLIEYAEAHPQASSVYCDMQFVGTMDGKMQHPSTTGFALQRVLQQTDRFNPAVIRCLIRADALRSSLPIKMVFTWGMSLARIGELHRVPELLYFRRIRKQGLTYTFLERPPEVLWQQSLEFALGLIANAYPLVPAEEGIRLFGFALHQLIRQRVFKEWLYDFGSADQPTQLQFVKEFLSETEHRFGWRPYPDLPGGSPAVAVLQKRRQYKGVFEGEDLIIDAMLSDPRISTASSATRSEALPTLGRRAMAGIRSITFALRRFGSN
jgi:hypothetical protein